MYPEACMHRHLAHTIWAGKGLQGRLWALQRLTFSQGKSEDGTGMEELHACLLGSEKKLRKGMRNRLEWIRNKYYNFGREK